MGTDIRLFVEHRRSTKEPWALDSNHIITKENGVISNIQDIAIAHRNYDLFYTIAGVRSSWSVVQLFEMRGLPPDLSPELIAYAKQIQGFGTSWISLSELELALKEIQYLSELPKRAQKKYKTMRSSIATIFDPYSQNTTNHMSGYYQIVNYAHDWIESEAFDGLLLNRSEIQPEIRFVFWFD